MLLTTIAELAAGGGLATSGFLWTKAWIKSKLPQELIKDTHRYLSARIEHEQAAANAKRRLSEVDIQELAVVEIRKDFAAKELALEAKYQKLEDTMMRELQKAKESLAIKKAIVEDSKGVRVAYVVKYHRECAVCKSGIEYTGEEFEFRKAVEYQNDKGRPVIKCPVCNRYSWASIDEDPSITT